MATPLAWNVVLYAFLLFDLNHELRCYVLDYSGTLNTQKSRGVLSPPRA